MTQGPPTYEVSLIVQNIQMVNQNVNTLRDDMNARIDDLNAKLDTHIKTDEGYWKQINERQSQLALLKGLTFSSFGLWVWTYFAEKLGLK